MAEVLVPMTGILEAAGDFPTEAVFNVSVVENAHLENCGVDEVGSNMVSSLSGLCLSVFGGFFLMIMPTRICHYYSRSHRHRQHHHDHHHQHRYHQHQF